MRWMILFVLALPAVAAEVAVLSTGFRIHAQRHEIQGETIRLYGDGGEIELPASAVVAFEPIDDPAPPAPPELPEPVTQPAEPKALIESAALRYGVPAELLESIAAAESSFDQSAVSHKGAIGVMQLMPATAAELGADPTDLEQNVDAGARYLRDLLLQYQGGLHSALAAYNAGPGAVSRYNGIPPYRETRLYVQRVLQRYEQLQSGSRNVDR